MAFPHGYPAWKEPNILLAGLDYWAWKTIMVLQYGKGFNMDATWQDVMKIIDAATQPDSTKLIDTLDVIVKKYQLTPYHYLMPDYGNW